MNIACRVAARFTSAARKLTALSPAEVKVLRLVNQSTSPVSMKELSRMPYFHGWDPASLESLIGGLDRMNLLAWNGAVLQPRFR